MGIQCRYILNISIKYPILVEILRPLSAPTCRHINFWCFTVYIYICYIICIYIYVSLTWTSEVPIVHICVHYLHLNPQNGHRFQPLSPEWWETDASVDLRWVPASAMGLSSDVSPICPDQFQVTLIDGSNISLGSTCCYYFQVTCRNSHPWFTKKCFQSDRRSPIQTCTNKQ